MGQLMWIEHRGFPGGPFSYYLSQGSSWTQVLGSSMDIVGNFMGDALLVGADEPPAVAEDCSDLDVNVSCIRQIYRCYIVWNSVWVALPLVLIFLASTGGKIDFLFGDDNLKVFCNCSTFHSGDHRECTPEFKFLPTKDREFLGSLDCVNMQPQRPRNDPHRDSDTLGWTTG
jgi:hypothetical protein